MKALALLPPPARWVLRVVRWRLRRLCVAARYGPAALRAAPRLLGLAQTKAGSHLLHQVLLGFAAIGPFVDTGMPPLNRDETNRKLPPEGIARRLAMLRPGDIAYGYLPARSPYTEQVTQPGWATVFILRDPRDIVVSHAFYIADMQPNHEWHERFRKVPLETRLTWLIQGHREGNRVLPSIRERCLSYLGWLEQPHVHVVRFEDLRLHPQDAVRGILAFVRSRGMWSLRFPEAEAVARIVTHIRPERSGTFRQGTPGTWQTYFTPTHKRLFKDVAGDLLIQMGYEASYDW